MEIYPEHHKDVVKSTIFYVIIFISPIAIVGLYLFMNGEISAGDIYNLGKTESGSSWASILGAMATIVVSFNVLQWEITKQLDQVSEKIAKGGKTSEKTLQEISKITIYYKISLTIGFIFLLIISSILISTISQISDFLISFFLYCTCSFSVFLMVERLDKANKIVVPDPEEMKFRDDLDRDMLEKALSIVVLWRLSLFLALFVFYSFLREDLAYILYSILIVFGFHKFFRIFFTSFTFTPNSFKSVLAFFLSMLVSFISWFVAIALGNQTKEGETSYLNKIEIPELLANLLSSEWFASLILFTIYILFFFDLLSAQNMFRSAKLRARSILMFSRDYSIIELNIYAVCASLVSLMLALIIVANHGLNLIAGFFIWVIQITFSFLFFPLSKVTLPFIGNFSAFKWVRLTVQSIFIGLLSNFAAIQLTISGKIGISSLIILIAVGGVLSFIYRFSGEYEIFLLKDKLDYFYNRTSKYLSKQYVTERERYEKIFPHREF